MTRKAQGWKQAQPSVLLIPIGFLKCSHEHGMDDTAKTIPFLSTDTMQKIKRQSACIMAKELLLAKRKRD